MSKLNQYIWNAENVTAGALSDFIEVLDPWNTLEIIGQNTALPSGATNIKVYASIDNASYYDTNQTVILTGGAALFGQFDVHTRFIKLYVDNDVTGLTVAITLRKD